MLLPCEKGGRKDVTFFNFLPFMTFVLKYFQECDREKLMLTTDIIVTGVENDMKYPAEAEL